MDNELKRLPNLHSEDRTWEKYYGKYHKKCAWWLTALSIHPID